MTQNVDQTRPGVETTHKIRATIEWGLDEVTRKAVPVGIKVEEYDLTYGTNDDGLNVFEQRNHLPWGIISLDQATSLCLDLTHALGHLAKRNASN
jgi:hypothetical protein